jgi:hypothetical protein
MPFALVAAAATAAEAAASVVAVIATAVRPFQGRSLAGHSVACPKKVLENPWIPLEIPPWLQLLQMQLPQQQQEQLQ